MLGFLDEEKITVTKLSVFYTGSGKATPFHSNRLMHGLVIRINGERNYIFDDGTEYTHRKYDIIYLPKGSTYNVKGDDDAKCYAINFSITEDATYPHFMISPKNGRDILNLFSDAYSNWASKKPGYYYNCLKDLYAIFSILKSQETKEYIPSSKEKLIYPAITYINEHLTDGTISISKLASICDISEVYFRRLFGILYGVSPKKYINNLKIERAEEMLVSDMYSVSEISDALGYTSPAVFSKDFKKYTGYAPGRYTRIISSKKEI